MIIQKAQSFGETSQVYEAQKLRELGIFPVTWISFGLNTRKSDSSEHAERMEKLWSYGQHDMLHSTEATEEGREKKKQVIRFATNLSCKRAQTKREQEATERACKPF